MKNSIFIRLKGGFGNQLFIYAFGFAQAKKLNKKLYIDNISGFGNKNDEYKSVYSLDGLQIKDTLISDTIYKYIFANRFFWYIAIKLNLVHIEESPKEYLDVSYSKKYFYDGYWQSHKYFERFRKEITTNLQLSSVNHKNIETYKEQILSSNNSVAIGMRFYEETSTAADNHEVKDLSFYKNAINIMEGKLSDSTYFVFSTDIKRASKILKQLNVTNAVFINPILDKNSAKFDLYLMSLCKNFILSNGTFYWWAAYLGEKSDSFIIAPKEGFINKDAIPNKWHQI